MTVCHWIERAGIDRDHFLRFFGAHFVGILPQIRCVPGPFLFAVTASAKSKSQRSNALTSVTDPAGNVTQYGYDTENNLTSITDANNHTTNFDYDAYGRVTKTTFPSNYFETYQ
ncbi:MAG: RHS repeat protein, partial [Acidobacteriota bacterium]|nr:RHS repeat protein [Acidobacteriota bacterium]